MAPKVSIIVPIYGVEKYLRHCPDSILAQTLKEIEVILVNDGSPDGCPAIVDDYAARDPRIVPVHQKNGGYGRAVNHGFEHATGEYIGIVEPDDWIEPEMYDTLFREALRNNLDVVKSNFTSVFPNNRYVRSLPNKWKEAPAEGVVLTPDEAAVFLYYHPSIWTCIYKRSFLESNRIRMVETQGAGWQDNPFQVQTLCLAKRIGFIRQSFYNYRIFTDSPSDALKNWHIPFERTAEIHAWLKENGFDRPPITTWLARREFAYLLIVAGKAPGSDWPDCARAIQSLAAGLPFEAMLATLPQKQHAQEQLLWTMAKEDPKRLNRYLRTLERRHKYRTFRRWLFSLRIRQATLLLTVCGRIYTRPLLRSRQQP